MRTMNQISKKVKSVFADELMRITINHAKTLGVDVCPKGFCQKHAEPYQDLWADDWQCETCFNESQNNDEFSGVAKEDTYAD